MKSFFSGHLWWIRRINQLLHLQFCIAPFSQYLCSFCCDINTYMGESMQAHQTLRHFFPSRRWMEATSRPPSQEDALTSSLKLRSDARPVTTTQYLKLIEQKNPTICFTKRLRLEGAECRVCLSEFQEGEKVRNLKCKHTFHRDCLDKWLQQYWATCPLCRNQVLPDDVVAKYRELQNQRDYVFSFWDLAE